MIAMALSCSPKLLIADEPTTALDVTTQAQIVELLHGLQREEDMAMIFVTHDLGVIADVADDVAVMYAGQIVEHRDATDLFGRPRHPYTEALLHSIPQLTPRGEPLHAIPGMVPRPDQFPTGCRFAPRCSYAHEACAAAPVPLRGPAVDVSSGDAGGSVPVAGSLARCVRQDELNLSGAPALLDEESMPAEAEEASEATPSAEVTPVLQATNLTKEFPLRSGILRRVNGSVRAVDDVSLSILPGTTLGLVGESGSGKSTLARVVLRLIDPTAGSIVVNGKDLTSLRGPALAPAPRIDAVGLSGSIFIARSKAEHRRHRR